MDSNDAVPRINNKSTSADDFPFHVGNGWVRQSVHTQFLDGIFAGGVEYVQDYHHSDWHIGIEKTPDSWRANAWSDGYDDEPVLATGDFVDVINESLRAMTTGEVGEPSLAEITEMWFADEIDEVARDTGHNRVTLAKVVSDELEFWVPTERDYEDDEVVVVRGGPDELKVPADLRDAVQSVHNRAAKHITVDVDWDVVETHDVYMAPKILRR